MNVNFVVPSTISSIYSKIVAYYFTDCPRRYTEEFENLLTNSKSEKQSDWSIRPLRMIFADDKKSLEQVLLAERVGICTGSTGTMQCVLPSHATCAMRRVGRPSFRAPRAKAAVCGHSFCLHSTKPKSDNIAIFVV